MLASIDDTATLSTFALFGVPFDRDNLSTEIIGGRMKSLLKKLVTAFMAVFAYIFSVIFWAGVSVLLAIENLFTRKHRR